MVNVHEKYIKRCLELAKKGLQLAMPNPSVGAVIVYEQSIIGEGYTAAYGGAHAEVNAINSVKNKSLLSQSTLYVSLEPCNHFGKTPPCTNLILEHKIPRVVVGICDSNPKVAGTGIKKLQDAGVEVIEGLLKKDCYELNKRFFTFYEKARPYIILKWAQSYNGFIAPKLKENQESFLISNEYSRQIVHKWRNETQAIMVGAQTVIDDNPSLTARDWKGRNPIRIVIDRNKGLDQKKAIFDSQAETIVIDDSIIDFNQNKAQQVVDFLFSKNIQSVIIEGGTKTIQEFINANIWDEAYVFVGDVFIEEGTKAPILDKKRASKRKILNDELLIYKNYD
jgi:diaminohydroxyphosphoribosylaminopyrimidine deaminase / 5-amino-6-(5-phosphoribosylamino)uracil reductase